MSDTDDLIGTLTGEYDDGSEWKASLSRDGKWVCDDAIVKLGLIRFDPRDYKGPPFPFGVPTLYEAAKAMGGATVELHIPMAEMPPGTVY